MCVAEINGAKRLRSVCENGAVLGVYRQQGGAALIQCNDASNSADNLTFIFDRRSRQGDGVELTGARWIRNELFGNLEANGIPDRFASVPLCAAPNPATAHDGVLLLISKTPVAGTADTGQPYCYRLLRVLTLARGISVSADDGRPLATASTPGKRWRGLSERLSPRVISAPSAKAAGVN